MKKINALGKVTYLIGFLILIAMGIVSYCSLRIGAKNFAFTYGMECDIENFGKVDPCNVKIKKDFIERVKQFNASMRNVLGIELKNNMICLLLAISLFGVILIKERWGQPL